MNTQREREKLEENKNSAERKRLRDRKMRGSHWTPALLNVLLINAAVNLENHHRGTLNMLYKNMLEFAENNWI